MGAFEASYAASCWRANVILRVGRQLIRQNASREGREMPLEIMYDSNESLSKAVAITTTTLQPLSSAAKKVRMRQMFRRFVCGRKADQKRTNVTKTCDTNRLYLRRKAPLLRKSRSRSSHPKSLSTKITTRRWKDIQMHKSVTSFGCVNAGIRWDPDFIGVNTHR